MGRFISPDSKQGKLSNPESLNLYIYVQNLPTPLIDPTGEAECSWNSFTWGGCAQNIYETGVNIGKNLVSIVVRPVVNLVTPTIKKAQDLVTTHLAAADTVRKDLPLLDDQTRKVVNQLLTRPSLPPITICTICTIIYASPSKSSMWAQRWSWNWRSPTWAIHPRP